MTDGLEHPDLGAVASEMRAEWRAEQEEATEDAAAHWRHSRTLADWLTQRTHAGDRIAISIGPQRFAGLVEEVGADLIGLRAVYGRVDIHLVPGLPFVIEMVDHPSSGGERPAKSRSFHETLIERDGRTDLTIGTVHDLEGLDGTLFVGKDFVSVIARLGAETVVPLQYVVWVSTRRT